MTINSVTDPYSNYYQASQTNSYGSIRQDINQLSTALSSGNISNAQSVFADLLQSLQTGGTSSASSLSSTSTTSNSNPVASDLQTLQAALKSGDVSTAQKALAALQKDMQSVQGVKKGGHRHHHKMSTDQSSTSTTTGATSTSSTSTQNTFQALISTITNLQSALNTGNLTDAQSAVNTLQSNNNSANLISGNGQTNQLFQSLQNFLQTGNLNSAQSSYSTFIQNLQNSFSGSAIGNIVDVKS